jgi:drug/metabolite transporter (DMT)-like permease
MACPLLGGNMSPTALLYGAASGMAMAAAIGCFYAALAKGPMSLVSPITAVLAAALPVLIGLLMGESLTTTSIIGIGSAILAIYLVSRQPSEPIHSNAISLAPAPSMPAMSPTVLALSLFAGTAFAVSFFFAHRVPANSGLWPIFVARVTATLAITAVFLVRRRSESITQNIGALRWAFIVGSLDAVANATMYYALQSAYLSTTSVIISLYPVFTVILAMIVIKERLGRLQQIGMGLALGSVITISYIDYL